MSMIALGPRGIWSFFTLLLSHRLLAVRIDRYYAVSKDTFLDAVAYKCERHPSRLNRTTECALLCSALGRPRCLASALGPDSCWVCGEDFGEIYPNEAIDTAMEFYSGGCENALKHIYIYHIYIKLRKENKENIGPCGLAKHICWYWHFKILQNIWWTLNHKSLFYHSIDFFLLVLRMIYVYFYQVELAQYLRCVRSILA